MASSEIEIASNALGMLGENSINTFDPEEGDFAALCGQLWPNVRDATLRMHPWSCARKRKVLDPLAAAPDFEWSYQFLLPSDFLRVIQIGEGQDDIPYGIEVNNEDKRVIVANDATIKLTYIFKNVNVGSYDDLLTMAMIAHMQVVLAYPVTKSTARQDAAEKYLTWVMTQARTVNGQEKYPEQAGSEHLVNARRGRV